MVAMSIDHLGEDSASLKRLLLAREAELAAARAAQATAEAEAARAQSLVKSAEAMIAHYKLLIEKLRRAQYGQRSERSSRLLDQLELQLEEAEATASEAALGAEQAAGTTVRSFTRRKQSRKPFPADLPRERVVVAAPKTCTCCGSDRLAKIGEDVTETLEAVPRQWKVIETVREKFTCRVCEKISQPPAPFHAIPRGLYGPSLLAMILFEKYGQHQPLNRQSRRFAHEGVDLSLSTLADQVGTCAAMVRPLYELQRDYVLSAERLHGDDTTVPVLAPAKTRTGRLWVYVRDDRPFKGGAPPAALFYYSPDRRGEHVERHLAGFAGILQADAYSGFNRLYETDRRPGPITEAACWAHGRRHFYELAEPSSRKNAKMYSPIALQAVQRIDALFAIEREITGQPADVRLDLRRQRSAPLVAELETWMKSERARLSRHADPAKAFDYMLTRWPAFTRFLDDGRICLSNNAAERALRGVALGRKSWMFAGSDAGGERAAVFYSLIVTARLNNIDPQAWLADVLARIADHPINRLKEFLPWNWCKPAHHHATIAA